MKSAQERKTRYSLLESWYGKERAQIEMAAHSSPTVSAADVIAELCSGLADPEIGHYIELEANWAKIIGPGPAATFARPAGLDHGVLLLGVRHSALIRELAPSIDLLAARINAHFGLEICREIRFVSVSGTRRN